MSTLGQLCNKDDCKVEKLPILPCKMKKGTTTEQRGRRGFFVVPLFCCGETLAFSSEIGDVAIVLDQSVKKIDNVFETVYIVQKQVVLYLLSS